MEEDDVSSEDNDKESNLEDSSEYASKKNGSVKIEDQMMRRIRIKKQQSDYEERSSQKTNTFQKMAKDIERIREIMEKMSSSMGHLVSYSSKERIQIRKIQEEPCPRKNKEEESK